MRRRWFILCSALSLLLCVAACVAWDRSWSARETWSARLSPSYVTGPEHKYLVVRSAKGCLQLAVLLKVARREYGVKPTAASLMLPMRTLTHEELVEFNADADAAYRASPWLRHRRAPLPPDPFDVTSSTPANTFWSRLGFRPGHAHTYYSEFEHSGYNGAYRMRFCVIPHWAVVAVSLVLPLWAAGRLVYRWRRESDGLCPACGYDLRATPARCPECGAVPT